MTATHRDEPHDHDRGLFFDLTTMAGRRLDRRLMDRRRALQMVGGAGLVALFGCGSDDGGGAAASSSTTTTGSPSTTAGSGAATDSSDCSPIPEETAGPYPGDGSNGPNVLTEDGIVRQDIRPSFGSATGLAEGVAATLDLAILDTSNGCAPLAGAAVYVWHCDRDGQYSLYSPGATDENYLRGVQETDSAGAVTFTSIFPACYPGRWPHIHFEVYASVADATGGAGPLATSQVALPEDVCNQAYGADGYDQSVTNLAQVSLEADNVFGDGAAQQLASVTGGVDDGFVIGLSVPV
jgi:protocatechuate 3,4-dioxygenase beta subunit